MKPNLLVKIDHLVEFFIFQCIYYNCVFIYIYSRDIKTQK
jgi:hypothetical protein